MKRLILYPYKLFSESARCIQAVVGGLRVRTNGSYKRKQNDFVINWGNSQVPNWDDHQILNHPNKTKVATNKLHCFKALEGKVPIPEFTTDKFVADTWDCTVVRHLLTGNSGRGIELVEKGGTLPDAPLYVKYKKKKKEFRVHVFKGEVIDLVEKRKRMGSSDNPDYDPRIRNVGRGWVFCRENITEPNQLREVAIKAIETLDLDFGAVDIVWNEKEDQCYCLEVNTAPGIEATTFLKYCEKIKECLN